MDNTACARMSSRGVGACSLLPQLHSLLSFWCVASLRPHTPFSRTRKLSTCSGPMRSALFSSSDIRGLSEEQITEAHAYAYGGAVIQDLGYYPFGSREFSDLVHYVRSGDFVRELLLESQDVDEYAFALGALSHYASDIAGHPAVNQAVAIEYPKLRAKYGKSVRYAQDKTAHLKTEFGFDTVQVAKNRYASQQYHDFIGFQVSKPLLERVFPVVYGMELKDVLTHEDLAVGSYRFAVSRMIPEMTQVALQTHKKDMMRETPNFAKKKFLYRLSRSDYEKQWGKDYVKAGRGHADTVHALAIHAESRSLQRTGVQQSDSAN